MTTQNEINPSKMRETILATACGGMAIALSTVLSMITVLKFANGGSITPASMLPLVFCALAFGPAWGIGISTVYGILQYIIAPYAVNIFSMFLDYPLAFGVIGLAGFLAVSKKVRMTEKNILNRVGLLSSPLILLAIFISMSARFLCHFISGIIYWTPVGENPWLFSLIYNGSYMLPELIITCVILIPLAAVFRPRKTSGQI